MKAVMTKCGSYVGAGAGMTVFILFGLLPGSLLGGAAGIKFAGLFFGLPLDSGIVPRVIVLISMLLGVLVSAAVVITALSAFGWLVGALGSSLGQKEAPEDVEKIPKAL